jgi:transcriptional regulator with PAS, ATPase and Fis domain
LAGITVQIPRLEQRRADIAPLFTHFLRHHSGGRAPAVEGRLLEQLLLQAWPGNVRELELLARRLLSLHGHEATLRRSFIQATADTPSASADTPSAPPRTRRAAPEEDEPQLERLREGLRRHGNLTRAAQEAGISRQRAYRLMGDRSRDELVREGSLLESESGSPAGQREDG